MMWKGKFIPRYLNSLDLSSNLSRVVSTRSTVTIAAEKGDTYFDDASLSAAKPFKEIPSMPMLPFIGTAWTYMPIIGPYELRKQHVALKDKHRKFGDIFRDKFGALNVVSSCNPDDFQTLAHHEGNYPSRGELSSVKVYRESRKQWYKSTGLLILEGKEWWDLRSKTQKHLMNTKSVQAFLNPMQEVAKDLVYKVRNVKDAKNEVSDFLGDLYKWSLESVALVGMDTRLGCLDLNLSPDSDGQRMIDSVQTQLECINKLEVTLGNIPWWKFFRTPTWKRFEEAGDAFGEIAFKHMNRAFDALKSQDEDRELTLLQSMFLTKGLDISGIMVTVADMLMAGIDTTSHTVGFFLYHMTQNPDKQELLHQEIQRLLPNKEDRITREVLNELRYLKACIKESQRLLPVALGMTRMLDRDIILSGYRIPAGTVITIAAQEMHLKEKYFTKPDQYLPERWLQKDEKFHPFAFRPFSVGTRSCIGKRIADLEIISVLTELIRNFKMEYHYEEIDMFSRLIRVPDKPLRFTFLER